MPGLVNVMSQPWPDGAERIRLSARRVLLFWQAGPGVICAGLLFYLLGFSGSRPHHVVLATVTTCDYFVVMVLGVGVLYYVRKSVALKEHT
jgi:hypothetical protein